MVYTLRVRAFDPLIKPIIVYFTDVDKAISMAKFYSAFIPHIGHWTKGNHDPKPLITDQSYSDIYNEGYIVVKPKC